VRNPIFSHPLILGEPVDGSKGKYLTLCLGSFSNAFYRTDIQLSSLFLQEEATVDSNRTQLKQQSTLPPKKQRDTPARTQSPATKPAFPPTEMPKKPKRDSIVNLEAKSSILPKIVLQIRKAKAGSLERSRAHAFLFFSSLTVLQFQFPASIIRLMKQEYHSRKLSISTVQILVVLMSSQFAAEHSMVCVHPSVAIPILKPNFQIIRIPFYTHLNMMLD